MSCLKGTARNVTSEEDCFNLFFSDEMFEFITSNINKRVDENLDKLRTFKEHTFNSSKYTCLKQTTKEELKAFIGLVYFRGFMVCIIITSSFCSNLALVRIFLVQQCPNSE